VLIEHGSNPTGDTFHGTGLCQGCGHDEETHDHHDRISGETGKDLTGSQTLQITKDSMRAKATVSASSRSKLKSTTALPSNKQARVLSEKIRNYFLGIRLIADRFLFRRQDSYQKGTAIAPKSHLS